MGDNTAIQWTDVTDNIIRVKGGGWWCAKISDGCKNCYAALLNQNAWYGGNKLAYSGKPPELILMRDIIYGWAKKTKPRKHFVSSMTDVFGDWVPREWIFTFLDGMAAAPLQTFQVLTKRADVMAREVNAWLLERRLDRVPRNIWLGFSAENQKCLEERLEHALKIPAVLFISAEPLLEKLDFAYACFNGCDPMGSMPGISWVIFGGESGKDARPCNVDWIRDGVKQCQAAGIAAFVKQLGANAVYTAANLNLHPSAISDPRYWVRLHGSTHHSNPLKHPKGGDMAEWPEDLRVRQFPEVKP